MKTYSRFSWQQINAQLCAVFCVLTMCLCLFASQYAEAQSQSRSKSRVCVLGLVQKAPALQLAALDTIPIPKRHARITFIGHSTMVIESPQGVSVATDCNGFNKLSTWPDIVTMNNSHITHYTEVIDPRIKFALRGWGIQKAISRATTSN